MPSPVTHGPWCNTKLIPGRCRYCKQRIYFFSCECGSKVFFDAIGGSWPIHVCPVHPMVGDYVSNAQPIDAEVTVSPLPNLTLPTYKAAAVLPIPGINVYKVGQIRQISRGYEKIRLDAIRQFKRVIITTMGTMGVFIYYARQKVLKGWNKGSFVKVKLKGVPTGDGQTIWVCEYMKDPI